MMSPTCVLLERTFHVLCIPPSTPYQHWLSVLTMAHNDCETGGAPSRSPSRGRRPRFYQETNDVQQNDLYDSVCVCSSNSQDSESPWSDERSIFNAIRVPTPLEDLSSRQTHAVLEDGLAANMAMFIPRGSSPDSPSSTDSPPRRGRGRQPVNWRNHVFSDQGSPRSQHLGSSPLNEAVSADDDSRSPHRKAVSLDAAHGDRHAPRWPDITVPVIVPAQPPYPPPERMPTPPGLPSFNTAEAVYYSAQFLAPRNGGRSSTPSPTLGNRAESPRVASYSQVLRRFWGATPSPEPAQPSVAGIGRADDGTIVQGRFPYRQSGHGTSLARQLEDHPFHHSNLPIAEVEADSAGGESTEELTMKEPVPRPKRHARLYSPPTIGRLWPSSRPRSSSPQDPGASAHLWRPLTPSSLLRLSRNSSQGNRRSRTPPVCSSVSHAGSSAQAGGTVESSSPSPSRLQSTLVQTTDQEIPDEQTTASRYSIIDVLSWLPIQMYICCCLGSLSPQEDAEDHAPLDIVSSRDTYVTAPSRRSATRDQHDDANENNEQGEQQGLQSWISSVYYSIRSRAPDPAQSL